MQLLLVFLIACVCAQLPDECFDETPVFGSTQNADYKSDLPFLQSKTFSNQFRISQINMCG